MDKPFIQLLDIRKVYGTTIKTEVLHGITFGVDKGEFMSIIGTSGSGKSTLLNIMGTLDYPSTGSYYFDGVELAKMKPQQLAEFRNQKLGFIFQFHHLLPEFTAIENVLMPYWIRGGTATKAMQKKAEAVLEMVNMSNQKNNKSLDLSGGQQQRVAIARALMNEPALVLADEPTGNLDSDATEQVYQLMKSINQELGTTFIIVTHDRHLAAKTSRMIEMQDGNIVRNLSISKKNSMEIWKDIRPCTCYLSEQDSLL